MKVDDISRVFQRINAIEERFGGTAETDGTFAQALSAAQQRGGTQTARTAAANGGVSGDNSDIGDMIRAAAAKYGVDPKLAMAVAKTESNLSPDAVSPVGAVGVMQLMPATADSLGVGNRFDPRENIDGGVRYIKEMMDTFNGDAVKAVAAYNAGPGAVQKYNGVPPYTETKNYVARVMDLYK
jgi:soluble lytic murein transglycosylase-like protein